MTDNIIQLNPIHNLAALRRPSMLSSIMRRYEIAINTKDIRESWNLL